jgi:phosphate transport system substrate-binding protein
MVSREIYPAEVEKGAWWVSVTKDAVVPTVHQNNPMLSVLLAKGVTRQTCADIWISGKVKTWGQVAGTNAAEEIHVYTRSDSCGAAETWANYLGSKQEDLLGVGVYGDPGLTEAVANDTLGIGYNNINYAYDAKTKKQISGIRVLPIDINDNGRIEKEEYFYDTRDEIAQAIAAGKYPSPPARNLHFVSKGRPQKKQVVEFLKWVLTDGQKFIPDAGYINLSADKISEQLKKLNAGQP